MHVLLAFLLLPAFAADPPLRSGCSPDDDELTRVSPDDAVQVEGALAGGEQTCYKVTLTRDGKPTTGYLLGETAPAVAAFVHGRERTEADHFAAEAARAAAAAAAAEAEATAAAAKAALASVSADTSKPAAVLETPRVFENFSARDLNGKGVSLAGLGGRVVLVKFWSPRNRASMRDLVSLQSLYDQYKGRGLRAIGISSDPIVGDMLEALDDVTLGFPQVPDRYGLTQRYATDGKAPTILVLDASHRIVGAGLTGAALERKIRDLLAE
jgi:hypothetical protein